MSHPALARTDHRPWPMPDSPWIWRQRWMDLLFVHWRLPSSLIRPLIPATLEIDEYDGSSWLGLVPFRMEDVMFRGLPEVPWLSVFPEMNLRLYVSHRGRTGVWFISLDATNPVAVWGARAFAHLPYFQAQMQVEGAGERVVYRSEREASARRVSFRGSYGPASEVFEPQPGSIEHFLTERYCLYTVGNRGELLTIDIQHPPWPLQRAEVSIEENTVGTAQGLPTDGRPLAHFSRRQDVVGWGLREIGPG
jgi:uncharacterized protein YqjF (DUF2071 family)